MARTDNLSNYLKDIAAAIKIKKGDNTPINASDFDTEIENLPTGGSSLYPLNVSNISVKSNDSSLTLIWDDPEDTYDSDGQLMVTWGATVVVRKVGSAPTSVNDGTIVVTNTIRGQYSTNGYVDSGLANDTEYFYGIFPRSDNGVYNTNSANITNGTPTSLRIYGIRRLITDSSPAWERTDDAVGLVANAQVGTTIVQNDFDNLYPWSDIISCNYDEDNESITGYYGDSNFAFDGSNGNVYTIIPEFWWKREQPGDGYEYISITNMEVAGYKRSEEFMIGRYLVSDYTNISGYSKSGDNVVPAYSKSYVAVRYAIQNTSKNRCLLDWHFFLIQLLFLVEYATYDSQSVLGKGLQMTVLGNNGICDNLGMKSGHPNNTTSYDGVIYRGIENLYGQGMCFVDGVMATTRYHVGVKYDPTTYRNNTYENIINYTIPYASSGRYISQLGYDSNNPLIMLPTNLNGSSTTYIPDGYIYEAYSSGGERPCTGFFNESTSENGAQQGLFGYYWSRGDDIWYSTFRVIRY